MSNKASYDDLLKKISDLEEEVETYRVLVENSPDLLYRTDLQGRITFISPSVYRLSGYTTEEAVGMKMAEEVYLIPEERAIFLEKLNAAGQVAHFEAQLKRKDGSIWWASTNAHLYRNKEGEIAGVEGIARDISETKAAERALRASEERFRLAFHTSPDAINLNRAFDGLFIDINDGFTKILGYTKEDVTGETSLSLNIWKNPGDRQRMLDGLAQNGSVENLEAEFVGKDGKTRTGLISARALEIDDEKVILTITRDISDKKRMEGQLQQTQKFEAIATLAGGVAHDFNNLLMGIQGRISLVAADLEPVHPHAEHLNAVEEYIRTATDLTKQLLGVARGGQYEVKPTDLNELLINSATMFGRTRKEIEIHTKLEEPSPVVDIDRSQIEQVLLNLYVNAWQAMPNGGAIYLESQIVELDAAYCAAHRVKPGRYAKFSITDTGIGMEESIRDHIFDPFFTTKGKGRGTGLGLASAYGIIKSHHGLITVYSEPGRGTTFNIHLPLSDKEAYQGDIKQNGIVRGSGTILLVDDEDMILEVGRAMLSKLGYRVVVAASGEQALDTVERMGDEIDVVVLDLIMPGMSGSNVFDGIRASHPQMPVILSSGYSINGQAKDIMDKGCNGFLQKPFNLAELSQKIDQVLHWDTAGGQTGAFVPSNRP
jgi:two-component system cell cycle sensor histidine kinase/response regulator CckA